MKTYNKGVTLMELMITVAVVAILASIAYPSYRNQIMRSNRAEAKVALMEAAQTLEKCFTQNSTYVGCAALTLPLTTPNGGYSIDEDDDDPIAASTYTLTATAQNGQADDKDCATLSIDQTNTQTAAKADKSENKKGCWLR